MNKKVCLSIDGVDYHFSLQESSDGKKVINIDKFHEKTNYYLFDSQLNNVAFATTKLSYSHNDFILYRDYNIEDLIEHSSFIEVAYLLIQGKLPTTEEFEKYSNALIKHSLVHEDMNQLYDSFPVNVNPLGVLAALVSSLSNYLITDKNGPKNSLAHETIDDRTIDFKYQLLSKVRTLAAWAYKKNIGHATIYPREELPYCANLLYMMFATPAEDFEIDEDWDRLLNKIFILYSDNHNNISTTTIRMLATSGANLFVCINAGISALWGTRDSFYQTLPMLRHMIKEKISPKNLIMDNLNQEKRLSLMTVFEESKKEEKKEMDIRAKIAARLFHEKMKNNRKASNDPIFMQALELEYCILNDPYCKDHSIYPNLDFYSTLLYRHLEIPEIMFNVFRVIGKLAGWLAHWQEQTSTSIATNYHHQPVQPNQIYTGGQQKKFILMKDR